MGLFHRRRGFSGTIARKRLNCLLPAERMACSPREMQMLKNDLIMTLARYLDVEEEKVSMQIDYSPVLLTIHVPLQNTEDIHA